MNIKIAVLRSVRAGKVSRENEIDDSSETLLPIYQL
jgi:hypothetical protein